MAPTKALRPIRNPEVVEDRVHRSDQDAGYAGHQRSQQVSNRSRTSRSNTHQSGAGPVNRGRPQRLSGQREIKKEKQQAAEHHRRDDDQDCLSGHVDSRDLHREGRQWFGPDAFGAEEKQAKSDQCEMERHRNGQQQENRGIGNRAEDDPVEKRRDRHDQQKGEHDPDRHGGIVPHCHPDDSNCHQGKREVKEHCSRRLAERSPAHK